MSTRKGKNGSVKSTVKKRTVNVTNAHGAGGGAPFNEQDIKRRLGNFNGAGEHSRKGGRTTGIVGQRKNTFRTSGKLPSKAKSK